MNTLDNKKTENNLNSPTKESILALIRETNFQLRIQLSEIPIEFFNNEEVVIAAIINMGSEAFKYAPVELQNNRDLILYAVMCDKNVLGELSPKFQDDIEIVDSAMTSPAGNHNYTCALWAASPRLRSDRNVVLTAVKNYGMEIKYANPCLFNDEEIMLAAYKNRDDDGSQYYGKPHTIEEFISPRIWKRINKITRQQNSNEGFLDNIVDGIFEKLDSFTSSIKNPKLNEGEWQIRYKNYQEQWKLELEKWELKILKQQQYQTNIQHENYRALRSKIEQMPIHERWKNDVFSKCGNICQICRIGSNLQVHHRESFYSIIKQNSIDSIEKAFECKQLWDVANGEVLCKECHDKMESSKKRQSLIEEK